MYEVSFKEGDINPKALATIRQAFFSKTTIDNNLNTSANVVTIRAIDIDEVFRIGSVLALGGLKKEQIIRSTVL